MHIYLSIGLHPEFQQPYLFETSHFKDIKDFPDVIKVLTDKKSGTRVSDYSCITLNPTLAPLFQIKKDLKDNPSGW